MTEQVQNLLLDWLDSARTQIESAGIVCRIHDGGSEAACTAVDLDGDRFVGTISYWAPETFEFQFNDTATGEVAVLQTKNFLETRSLAEYVAELLVTLDKDLRK